MKWRDTAKHCWVGEFLNFFPVENVADFEIFLIVRLLVVLTDNEKAYELNKN